MVRAFSFAIVLALLTAGCVRGRTETPQPQPTPAPAPVAKAPASQPKGTATPPASKAPPAKTPAPTAQKPPVTKAQPAPAAGRSAPAAPLRPGAAGQTLNLEALKTQLKETKAIGIFTKLTLKNQVDDLLDKFREHHSGKPTPTIAELRRSYDLLMMKVLSLLQDHDQRLASAIVSSREAIWGLLADPRKFATLEV